MSKTVEIAKIQIAVHILPYRGRYEQISIKIEIALYKYTPQSIDLSAGKNVKILMKTAKIDKPFKIIEIQFLNLLGV